MGKVILIVEDNLMNLKLVRDLLQIKRYTTLEAGSGKLGVALAVTHRPDLILMDIQLPDIDGFEATRMLKADPATRNIPVIALTSYAMKGDREKALEAGMDDYLTKPIDIHEFLKKVAAILPLDG